MLLRQEIIVSMEELLHIHQPLQGNQKLLADGCQRLVVELSHALGTSF